MCFNPPQHPLFVLSKPEMFVNGIIWSGCYIIRNHLSFSLQLISVFCKKKNNIHLREEKRGLFWKHLSASVFFLMFKRKWLHFHKISAHFVLTLIKANSRLALAKRHLLFNCIFNLSLNVKACSEPLTELYWHTVWCYSNYIWDRTKPPILDNLLLTTIGLLKKIEPQWTGLATVQMALDCAMVISGYLLWLVILVSNHSSMSLSRCARSKKKFFVWSSLGILCR